MEKEAVRLNIRSETNATDTGIKQLTVGNTVVSPKKEKKLL